jgi:hypothetical protein
MIAREGKVAVYRVPENGFDSVGYYCKPLRILVGEAANTNFETILEAPNGQVAEI